MVGQIRMSWATTLLAVVAWSVVGSGVEIARSDLTPYPYAALSWRPPPRAGARHSLISGAMAAPSAHYRSLLPHI